MSIPRILQAFLLGIAYMMFSLWKMIDVLQTDLGGNSTATEFMLFMKTRQVAAGHCKKKAVDQMKCMSVVVRGAGTQLVAFRKVFALFVCLIDNVSVYREHDDLGRRVRGAGT